MQRILCLHFSGSVHALSSVRKLRAIQVAQPAAEIELHCDASSADVFTLLIDRTQIHTQKPKGIAYDLVYDLSPESTTFWTRLSSSKWPKTWTEMASLDWLKSLPTFDLAARGISGKYIVYALEGEFVTQVLDYPNQVRMIDQLGLPIIVIGNAWDENYGYRFHKIFPDKVHNLCQLLSHADMCSVIQGAEFLITHDSAMLDITQALGKKTFAIFGSSKPTVSPSETLTILENKALACRPCRLQIPNYCPLDHFQCMKDIDLSPIIHASQTL
jgi:ADP-heptose:LPS heptosyltransferase